MDWGGIIRQEIARLRAELLQEMANQIQISTTTLSTADGEEDGVDGNPEAGASYQRSPRRWQHFGLRSRPPKSTARIFVLVGRGTSAEASLAEDSSGYGPDPGEGGIALFSEKSGCSVVLGKDGIVTVNAASGQKVVVNADHVFLGAEAGAEALVRKSDFDGHVHLAGTLLDHTAGAVTGATAGAVAVPGTTNTKAR